MLDIDAVHRSLLHLDLSVYAPPAGALAEHARHYGIDMEAQLPGVRHYTGWFEAPGYQLAAHVFLPQEARCTLFILHGYLDHSGLYRHLIRDALTQGAAVFIFDLPGHGFPAASASTFRILPITRWCSTPRSPSTGPSCRNRFTRSGRAPAAPS